MLICCYLCFSVGGDFNPLFFTFYSQGILMYEMMTGIPPFYGENPFSVYQKILEGKISFAFMTPKATQSVISGFLTSNRIYRLGCGAGGFDKVRSHPFFTGIEWNSASMMLLMPPVVPTVQSDGDTSNFDVFPDEALEEQANLTSTEREMFREFDRILERPVQE